LLLSSAYVVRFLVFRSRDNARGRGLEKLVVFIVIGVLVNALVCGTLSEPYDRYQARVVWLIPFLAWLIYQMRSRRSAAAATPIPSARNVDQGRWASHWIKPRKGRSR
jgi:hypothetical protein